jgi:mannose-6-phosphate isomerase-like protein (cupin superfamily)
MAETLKLTPGESVTIRQSSPEVLEVEGTYGPGGKPPPAHYHPAQDEHFEVLEGTLRAKVGGEERDLDQGEVLDIPLGTPHQMWNPGDQSARVLWQTRPSLRTAGWFRSIDALHREGRVGRNGMPGPLAFGALLSEYDDVFRLAGPRPLVKPAVAVLGALGRARGYKPRPETFSAVGP